MIRLGLVGCGHMMVAHIREAEGLDQLCEYTAMCDIVEERAKSAAEATGAGFWTTDYTQMLDYVDAVVVALPHELHYECGIFFLKNNKHVLMEKPLCNTEEECLGLVKEAADRDLILMCEYPVRYYAGIRKLKSLLDSGEYGEIFQMSIWTEQYTDQYYENLDYRQADWILDEKRLGGGQLFSHGCHYIDILLWFLGKPVSGVHFGTNKGTPWMAKEGTSNVVMRFENGVIGYHFGTWGARGTSHGYSWQVFTDKGFFEFTNGKLTFKRQIDPYNVSEPKEIEWDFTGLHYVKDDHPFVHFANCVKDHKVPLTDGKAALESLRVIWKLYESEQKNEIADLTSISYEA